MDEKVIQAGMFDQKSTGSERQQFLKTILHAVTTLELILKVSMYIIYE